MCLILDSVQTLGVPLLQGGLTAYTAMVRRHLSGLIRNPEVYFANDFAEV